MAEDWGFILTSQLFVENRGIIMNYFFGILTVLSDTKFMVSNDFECEPLKFPPIRTVSAWMLAESWVADIRGFIEFFFENTEHMTIFREKQSFGPKNFCDTIFMKSNKSTIAIESKHKFCFLTFYTKIHFFPRSKSTQSLEYFEPYGQCLL